MRRARILNRPRFMKTTSASLIAMLLLAPTASEAAGARRVYSLLSSSPAAKQVYKTELKRRHHRWDLGEGLFGTSLALLGTMEAVVLREPRFLALSALPLTFG